MPTDFENRNLHRFCPEDQRALAAMMYSAVIDDDLATAKLLLDSYEADDLRANLIDTIGYVSGSGNDATFTTFDEAGSSMLALARSRAMGEFLIRNGADLLAINKLGETQQVTATRLGNSETVRIISDYVQPLLEKKVSEFLSRRQLGLETEEPK